MNNNTIDLEINTESIIKNDDFIKQFRKTYSDWDLKSIDKELLVDIILTMFEENLIKIPQKKTIDKLGTNTLNVIIDNSIQLTNISDTDCVSTIDHNNKLVEDVVKNTELYGNNYNTEKNNKIILNRIIADEKIPELLIPDNVILIKGLINDISINILIDTGASGCCISVDSVRKCGLMEIFDDKNILSVQGISKKITLGKIWYLELNLLDSNDNYRSFPTCCDIIDGLCEEIDLILGSNFLRKYNCCINFYQRFIILEDANKKHFFINFN